MLCIYCPSTETYLYKRSNKLNGLVYSKYEFTSDLIYNADVVDVLTFSSRSEALRLLVSEKVILLKPGRPISLSTHNSYLFKVVSYSCNIDL